MEYTIIETTTKPKNAPDIFCVYKIDGEEYIFSLRMYG